MGHRYYSPELCRFIKPDDIEYLDPENINWFNLYCYCFNNPVMYADPSGHSAILVALLVGAIVGGVTYSVGAALTIGSGIAFGSGFIGGMAADALTQVANDGGVNDWWSVFVSGFQWGLINTASAFLGSLGGPISTLDSALLSGIFGSVTSAVGMTIDIFRNRKTQKQKGYVNSQFYAYGF